MWQFGRDNHGNLTEPGHYTVFLPCALENHLVHPVLFNRIGVGAPFRQQSPDYPHGMLVMAVEQILPHKIPMLLILFHRPVIHVNDNPILIANRNAAIQPFSPIWYHNHLVLVILKNNLVIFVRLFGLYSCLISRARPVNSFFEKQLVPRKRFRRYNASFFLSFVPINRFRWYKIMAMVLPYVTLADSCKETVPFLSRLMGWDYVKYWQSAHYGLLVEMGGFPHLV